jgi:CheY-like chemotaxis protein
MTTVLVVDDDEDIRDVLRLNLEPAGYRVLAAADGAEALEMVERSRPDAIVLDVVMPRVDGWEVLRRLKARASELEAVPVVMLTALGDREDRLRGGIEGAIRYMTKPFDPAALVALISEMASDGAPPEPEVRRHVQRESLAELARLDRGEPDDGVNVRLTRLDRVVEPERPSPGLEGARANLRLLTEVQRTLIATVSASDGVTDAARRLGTSRANVYASLQRVARKLGVPGPQLLAWLEDGSLRSP